MNLAQRKQAKTIMGVLERHKAQLHYNQHRPMVWPTYAWHTFLTHLLNGDAESADCSETITSICKWIGVKDPSGNHYNGYGSTETMLAHLPHYFNARQARIGSIVHFTNPNHVSMVYKPDFLGGNPLLFSFGSEDGPNFHRLKDEHGWHPGPVTLLNVSKL